MIASALVYARYTNHLQFTLVEPNNEPDIAGSGIETTETQYPVTLDDLSQQLNANGMGDVRFIGPDLGNTSTAWLSTMMNDPTVMAKLAGFGIHGYQSESPGSAGVSSFLQQSAFPNIPFWMTEYNVWCQVCQTGGQGTNNWEYFLGTAEYLLENLANGASGGMVWEGYDSIYRNNNNDGLHWSFWGLFAVNDTNAVPKTYTARKNFYTLSQITAFVRPGAQQIDVSGLATPLTLLAFYNTNNGQFTLAGANTNSSASNLSCALTSLPAIPSLDFFYTSNTTNFCYAAQVPVTNGDFSVSVPASCVFTLTYTNHPPRIARVSVAPLDAGQTITITNSASDPDSPPQTLTFALLTAPAGSTLDTNTGVFTWYVPVAFANTTNLVELDVTDNGYPPLSATQSFSLVVNPLTPPTLLAPAFVAPLDVGQTITITNSASDPNSPPQTLTFALLTAPAGATLDANTGVFTWRAPVAFANTTNLVVLDVTDNGYPPLSATQSFSLVVNPLTPPTLLAPALSNGLLTLETIGPIGPDYLLQRSSNLTTWSTIFTTTPLLSPFTLTDTNTPLFPATFYRILLGP
jgi:O-glycosyl hydrolase